MIEEERIREELAQAMRGVRSTTPLVGSITNSVTINLVANAQLAVGGSAAMVYLVDEAEFLVQAARAMYLNMGTLLPLHEETMPHVAHCAHKVSKPWILDPVGIGIGSMRTGILKRIKDYKPTIIRGNASEIIALAGLWGLSGGVNVSQARGVDSTDEVQTAKEAAISLAQWTEGAVSVSGEVDLVTDGNTVAFSSGGSALMKVITGSGCSLGGISAVYAAVTSPFSAALAATAHYNVAGRVASGKTNAPGSFQVEFLDALHKTNPEDIAENELIFEEV